MGMRFYGALTGLKVEIEPFTPYKPEEVKGERAFRLPTARDITLAQYDPSSRDAITAHNLADYRRRRFSLVLLPDVDILMDEMLKPPGVESIGLL